MKILSLCNNLILSNILERVALSSGAYLLNFDNIEDALFNLNSLRPDMVIVSEDFSEEDFLKFIRGVRERYSLIVPIYVILNFHTSFNISQIKNLGVETIIKPVSENSLRKKLFPNLKLKDSKIAEEISNTEESPSLKIDEIIEKLKPYISQEIKRETRDVIKKLLEVLERRDESESYFISRNL